jgi:hypothetical protein
MEWSGYGEADPQNQMQRRRIGKRRRKRKKQKKKRKKTRTQSWREGKRVNDEEPQTPIHRRKSAR